MNRCSPKRRILNFVNHLARPFGVALVPLWRYDGRPTQFVFAGRSYYYFTHHYNCGWHPASGTERTVELALADAWLTLARLSTVVEVGAVTPYYWPGRVNRVIDPADDSPMVTDRVSMLDFNLNGASVLCISTLEHVGSGEYGLQAEPRLTQRAVEKLFSEPSKFLATIPMGYNPYMDDLLFRIPIPTDVSRSFLVRTEDGFGWREERNENASRLSYGHGTARCANSVAILERGGLLINDGAGSCSI
jgi:hypothetical protein